MYNTDGKQPVTNAEAGVDAGIALANVDGRVAHLGKDNDIPVGLVPAGMKLDVLKGVLETEDARAQRPRRLKGSATFTELDSFIAHVNAFKDPDTVIFADTADVQLTAVLNYHHSNAKGGNDAVGDDRARWADHRSVYACPLSEAWERWTGLDGTPMRQEAFAQFIEDNMVDLANPEEGDNGLFPSPAAVLEMARNLSIKINGEFSKSINPTTGEATLINKTEHGPTSTKIPRAFLLKLAVFEAGVMYRVEARLRFSLADGRPTFSYALYQAEAIKRDAFGSVRAEVAKGTTLPVYAGAPEA